MGKKEQVAVYLTLPYHAESASLSLLCEACRVNRAIRSLTWQPCLHVSRAREQGSSAPNDV